MAITITQRPTSPNAAFTKLPYVVSGSVTTGNPQYQYVMDVYESGSSDYTRITQTANPAGVGVFNPSRIAQGMLSSDVQYITTTTVVSNNISTANTFEIKFGEQYGTSASSSVTVYPDLATETIDLISAVVSPTAGTYNFDSSSFLVTGRGENDWALSNCPLLLNYDRKSEPVSEIVYKPINSIDYETVSFFTDEQTNTINVQVWNGERNRANVNISVPTYGDGLITYAGVGPKNLSEANYTLSSSFADYWTHYTVNINTSTSDETNLYFVNDQINPWYIASLGIQTTLQPIDYRDKTRFIFKNEYGVWDYYNVYNPVKRNSDIVRNNVTLPNMDYSSIDSTYDITRRGEKLISQDIKDRFSVDTFYLDQNMANWIEELIESPEVYVQMNGSIYPIIITNSSYIANSNQYRQKLFNYTIEFEPANQPWGEWQAEQFHSICPAEFILEIDTDLNNIDYYNQYWTVSPFTGVLQEGYNITSGSYSFTKYEILPKGSTVSTVETVSGSNDNMTFSYIRTLNGTIIQTDSGTDVQEITEAGSFSRYPLHTYKAQFDLRYTEYKATYSSCNPSGSYTLLVKNLVNSFPTSISDGNWCYTYINNLGDGSDGFVSDYDYYIDCPTCDYALWASSSLGYKSTGQVCLEDEYLGLSDEDIKCAIQTSMSPISETDWRYRRADGFVAGTQLFDENYAAVTSSGNLTSGVVLVDPNACESSNDLFWGIQTGSIVNLTSGVINTFTDLDTVANCTLSGSDVRKTSYAFNSFAVYPDWEYKAAYHHNPPSAFTTTYKTYYGLPSTDFIYIPPGGEFGLSTSFMTTWKDYKQNTPQADTKRNWSSQTAEACPAVDGGYIWSGSDNGFPGVQWYVNWVWRDAWTTGNPALPYGGFQGTYQECCAYTGSFNDSVFASGSFSPGTKIYMAPNDTTTGTFAWRSTSTEVATPTTYTPIRLFGDPNQQYAIRTNSSGSAKGTIIDILDANGNSVTGSIHTRYEGPYFWRSSGYTAPIYARDSGEEASSTIYIEPNRRWDTIQVGDVVKTSYDSVNCTYGGGTYNGQNKWYLLNDYNPDWTNRPATDTDRIYQISSSGEIMNVISQSSNLEYTYWELELCNTNYVYRTSVETGSLSLVSGSVYNNTTNNKTYTVTGTWNPGDISSGSIAGTTGNWIITGSCPPVYTYYSTAAPNQGYWNCGGPVQNGTGSYAVYSPISTLDLFARQNNIVYTDPALINKFAGNGEYYGLTDELGKYTVYCVRVNNVGTIDLIRTTLIESGSIVYGGLTDITSTSFIATATGSDDNSNYPNSGSQILERGFYIGTDSGSATANTKYVGTLATCLYDCREYEVNCSNCTPGDPGILDYLDCNGIAQQSNVIGGFRVCAVSGSLSKSPASKNVTWFEVTGSAKVLDCTCTLVDGAYYVSASSLTPSTEYYLWPYIEQDYFGITTGSIQSGSTL